MAGAMCIGDAASLVDPFSGEGVGNALLSAKLAISLFDRQKHSDGFPSNLAEEYMTRLWEELGPELSNSFKIQKIVRRKRLMNLFVKKAAKRPALQDALTDALASKEAQKNCITLFGSLGTFCCRCPQWIEISMVSRWFYSTSMGLFILGVFQFLVL